VNDVEKYPVKEGLRISYQYNAIQFLSSSSAKWKRLHNCYAGDFLYSVRRVREDIGTLSPVNPATKKSELKTGQK